MGNKKPFDRNSDPVPVNEYVGTYFRSQNVPVNIQGGTSPILVPWLESVFFRQVRTAWSVVTSLTELSETDEFNFNTCVPGVGNFGFAEYRASYSPPFGSSVVARIAYMFDNSYRIAPALSVVPGFSTQTARPLEGSNGWAYEAYKDATRSTAGKTQIDSSDPTGKQLTVCQFSRTGQSNGGPDPVSYLWYPDGNLEPYLDNGQRLSSIGGAPATWVPNIVNHYNVAAASDPNHGHVHLRIHCSRVKLDLTPGNEGNVLENVAPTTDLWPFSDGENVRMVARN